MNYQSQGKRLFDLVVTVMLLMVLLPVILGISLLLLTTEGRPVLFRQTRVGRDFKHFRIVKFRTMAPRTGDAESGFQPGQQPGVTSVGRMLRANKLDELPQLWNVLCDDMSLVGPRPEVPEWVDRASQSWVNILSAKPGITDYASVKFIDESSRFDSVDNPGEFYRCTVLPEKMALGERYVREMSFRADAGILFKTVRRLLGN